MVNLNEWAMRWGVSIEALEDLRREMGTLPLEFKNSMLEGLSEAAIQNNTRLDASRKGAHLWRNNVGACYTDDGAFIRFGLANDSERMNKALKSSDLIGIEPVMITSRHVGRLFGRFVARECKPEKWVFTGTDREQAQLKFIELINSLGGNASFTTRGEL